MNDIIAAEAILFALDSIDLYNLEQIKHDIDLKLKDHANTHPDTIKGIKYLQGVIEAREEMKSMF